MRFLMSLHNHCLPFLVAGSLALPCWGQAPVGEQGHIEVTASQTLAVQQVLAAALQRAPERLYNRAYSDQAGNQQRASESLIAGAPRLVSSYRDDRTLDDTGLLEMEAGIEMDLWKWGERENAGQLADSLQAGSEAWQGYLPLIVAGEVRESLHRLAAATVRHRHAQESLEEARALQRISQQLLDTGAISRSAAMQGQTLVLEAQRHLLDTQAQLVDAERRYHTLTGLDQRPATFTESPPLNQAIDAQHPRLQFLQARRQQQFHRVQQQRYQSSDSVTLSLGVRRERGAFDEPEVDSFGVSVSVPFGGGSHRDAAASAAAVALTEADVQLQQARRDLVAQLHEIQHQLEILEHTMAVAASTRDLNRERWQMTQKAFSLGESDIQPTIRALREYRQSRLQWQLLGLKRNALISSLKQTVGELP